MSHMSAANTPATGPIQNHGPPPLDLNESLAHGESYPPIHEHEQTDFHPSTASNSSSNDLDGFGPGHPLFEDLAPEDSYKNGVYWVGLPL